MNKECKFFSDKSCFSPLITGCTNNIGIVTQVLSAQTSAQTFRKSFCIYDCLRAQAFRKHF